MVAACSLNDGIIGVNGSIPWPSIPQDRQLFKRLTQNRILIIGRRTLEERWPQLDHVDHCIYVIVVSRTVSRLSDLTAHPTRDSVVVDSSPNLNGNHNHHEKRRRSRPQKPLLRLARSLDEALELARNVLEPRIVQTMGDGDDDELQYKLDLDTNPLTCWVAGGENLYREALGHVDAGELHLSVVDFYVEVEDGSSDAGAVNPPSTPTTTVARFPDPSTWNHLYRLISETKFPSQGTAGDTGTEQVDDNKSTSLSTSTPSFTYRVYRKMQD